MFSWLDTTGYYSNTYFKYGWNNFVGIIFWQTGLNVSPQQEITINSGTVLEKKIACSEQLRGIYYNNQRGRRIWPLDTGNLQILQTSPFATWYGDLTMENWFFTHCIQVIWWGGYIPGWNDVYGQIDHTLSGGQTFRMIAWVEYDFTWNNIISGSIFSPTFQLSWGLHTWWMFDDNWGIAELSVNIPWCQSFQSTPSIQPIIISQGSGMQFHCFGENAEGYILSIGLSWGTSPFYTTQAIQTGTYQWRLTWSALAIGDYRATCTVQWPSGSGPQCGNQIPFHVWDTIVTPPVWSGCNPNFQWEITFSSYNGSTVINPSLGSYITNKTWINLQWAATEPNNFAITGDFTLGNIAGFYTWTNIFTHLVTYPIQLLTTTGWNNFVSTFITTWSTGSCTYSDAPKRVYVDIIPPTAPVVTVPTNGAYVCPSLLMPVTRSASIDTGSNISHYRYEIYDNNGMSTGIMMSWTTTSLWISLNVALLPLWTYYMRILAVDNVNMVSSSTTVSFTTSSQYCLGTGVVIVTPIIWLRNVDLDKVYRSDPIIILGLTGPTLVSISKGMLFINNGTGVWNTTGMVSSNDTIYIELISSGQYDATVSSTLSVLWLTGTFLLTTKSGNCVLSAAEQLVIQNIYANLKMQYNNDISKLSEFLNTFQSMVEDESELTNSCTLEYLLQLIRDDLGFDGNIDTSNHIAPNCKEYTIGYDGIQHAYYAPETISRFYFVNRETLIRHLDYYNPGDCHINTYGNNLRIPNANDPMKHIAPNGKIYHFVGQYGGFSATEFPSAKYFDSLESIIRYIDLRNPPKEIWTHTVNTAFTPITFAAPNGREYRIFNTDRWYMSYKLMKVKYYPTLSELKNYINRNNPSKR